MSANKSILVVIDPTADQQPALERAAWLAGQLGASLELLICDYDQHLSGGRFFSSDAMEGAQRELLKMHELRLEALAAPLREQGITVGVDARWEHPLDHGVLRKAAELQPIIVAKDTHYHSAIRRALFSNTDWSLIHSCSAPLLLVKPRQFAAEPKILAAVDPLHAHAKPAELDHAILALAKELATALHGDLQVFHSFDPAPVIAGATGSIASPIAVPVRELTAALEQSHRKALAQLLDAYPVPDSAVHLHQGVAAEALLALSSNLPADIVIMGAISRSGLKKIFIGNTAERVLDRLPCDLLIVKPAGFAIPVT
ncbi:MAG: universal stress protein [Gammaproteobacteria bacterium]|nr:universal stress protein [Gammaproteobacteria bacterium]MDH3506581.1 universal stress protein [Gammaproteobacteria bacterium]